VIGVGHDSVAAILIRSLLPFFGEYEMETFFSGQDHAAKPNCRDFSSGKFPRSVSRGAGVVNDFPPAVHVDWLATDCQ
jgi:hypothetical protein